jgi:hypothetical protein
MRGESDVAVQAFLCVNKLGRPNRVLSPLEVGLGANGRVSSCLPPVFLELTDPNGTLHDNNSRVSLPQQIHHSWKYPPRLTGSEPLENDSEDE